MAPDGKEVEELTGKEALQALRKKFLLKNINQIIGQEELEITKIIKVQYMIKKIQINLIGRQKIAKTLRK